MNCSACLVTHFIIFHCDHWLRSLLGLPTVEYPGRVALHRQGRYIWFRSLEVSFPPAPPPPDFALSRRPLPGGFQGCWRPCPTCGHGARKSRSQWAAWRFEDAASKRNGAEGQRRRRGPNEQAGKLAARGLVASNQLGGPQMLGKGTPRRTGWTDLSGVLCGLQCAL